MRRHHIAVVLSLCLRAGTSLAAPATAHDDVYTIAAHHFDEGKRIYRLAEQRNDPALYEKAYAEFRVAYDAHPTVNGVWNLVLSEVQTKRFVDAIAHAREFRRRDAAVADPAKKSTASEQATLQAAWDQAYAATGHVLVTAPQSALVFVDGKALGERAPLAVALDLAPGGHEIWAKVDDVETARRGVDLTPGITVTVDLRPSEASQGIPPPAPVVTSAAPAPSAIPTPNTVPASTDRAPTNEALSPFLNDRRVAGLIVGGVGVASLIGGGVFAALSNHEASDADATSASLGVSACPRAGACGALNDQRQAQTRDWDVSLAFTGVGAAALAAGAILLLWPSSHDGSPSASLTPLLSPQGAGLAFRGNL